MKPKRRTRRKPRTQTIARRAVIKKMTYVKTTAKKKNRKLKRKPRRKLRAIMANVMKIVSKDHPSSLVTLLKYL